MLGWQRNSTRHLGRQISPSSARGESVTHGPCNCFLYDRMAQRPAVLENLVFVFLGVLASRAASSRASEALPRIVSSTSSRTSRQYSIASFTSLLREVVHLLSADPEEGLPAKFSDTHRPRLSSSEEFDAVSLLLSQKLIQRKGGAPGVAKIAAHFPIDRVLGA